MPQARKEMGGPPPSRGQHEAQSDVHSSDRQTQTTHTIDNKGAIGHDTYTA
jgi:hypothetical protein